MKTLCRPPAGASCRGQAGTDKRAEAQASAFLRFYTGVRMSIITGLTAAKGRDKRINVSLDGRPGLSLSAEVALKAGLWTGRELSLAEWEALAAADRYQKCLDAAYRLLAVRPRSEDEIRQRLQKRGFESDDRDKAIARLREQGLVDDDAFARYWKDNRQTFRPRSRRLTAVELRRKGLDRAAIEPVVAEIDDSENAYRAALGRAPRLAGSDYEVFRRRLGEYLVRRGFDYDIIQQTVNKVWIERGEKPRKYKEVK
jgi:regulatory protein